MKTLKKTIEWYESQPDEIRVKLQSEFGQYDIPNREIRFYEWLNKNGFKLVKDFN